MASGPAHTCVFCAIERGEQPARIVLEDDTCVAFLDQRPIFPGHTLLIPRAHHETLTDLPSELVEPLFARARLLAGAVRDSMAAEGTFVALNNKVSQSVPHLHVHVVPRSPKDGLRGFFWPRQRYRDDGHAQEVAASIRAAVATLGTG
jgi:histidine triad (HIT) family protein